MSCKFKVGDRIYPLSRGVFESFESKGWASIRAYDYEIKNAKIIIVRESKLTHDNQEKLDLMIDGSESKYFHPGGCFYKESCDIEEYRENN